MGRALPALRLLQLLPGASFIARHACNGSHLTDHIWTIGDLLVWDWAREVRSVKVARAFTPPGGLLHHLKCARNQHSAAGRKGTANTRTFIYAFGYTDSVLTRKPVNSPGQDLRDLPTYTIPEAAICLGIPERTLRSWFAGSHLLLCPAGEAGKIPLLSFRNLVDAHIVQTARLHHHVPMSRIRAALETAFAEGKSKYPLQDKNLKVFARYLVRIEPGRGKRKRAILNLSKCGQEGIPEVIDLYTQRILRDANNVPIALYPWRLWQTDTRSRPVSIHPHIMSGRLVVAGTRIPVSLLAREHLSGRSPIALANDYNLDIKVVEEALSHLDTKAA